MKSNTVLKNHHISCTDYFQYWKKWNNNNNKTNKKAGNSRAEDTSQPWQLKVKIYVCAFTLNLPVFLQKFAKLLSAGVITRHLLIAAVLHLIWIFCHPSRVELFTVFREAIRIVPVWSSKAWECFDMWFWIIKLQCGLCLQMCIFQAVLLRARRV